MKTTEQSHIEDAGSLLANETLISRLSQRTSMPTISPVARRKHWRLAVFVSLISLGTIPGLIYLLRAVPADALRQEFEGLGIVICALAYLGLFLRQVSRALAQEARQAEES